MARPVWSGTISFGLVNVAVKALSAVRDHDVHFHQLDKKTGARVRNRKVSEKTGREVDDDDITMGFELSDGHYVTFDKDELEDLRPQSTRAIEVTDFVALEDIDPIYYERTYWLEPDESAVKPYQLLLAAMEDRKRAAIGTVVMRNKEYLTAIRPLDGVLAMSTMRFSDEVVPAADAGVPKNRAKVDAKTLRMATQLIDALESEWNPSAYHDTYTDELRHQIEARAKGGARTTAEPKPEETDAKVIDLFDALQSSLDNARGRSRPKARSQSRSTSSSKSRSKSTSKASSTSGANKKSGAASGTKRKATSKRTQQKRKSA